MLVKNFVKNSLPFFLLLGHTAFGQGVASQPSSAPTSSQDVELCLTSATDPSPAPKCLIQLKDGDTYQYYASTSDADALLLNDQLAAADITPMPLSTADYVAMKAAKTTQTLNITATDGQHVQLTSVDCWATCAISTAAGTALGYAVCGPLCAAIGGAGGAAQGGCFENPTACSWDSPSDGGESTDESDGPDGMITITQFSNGHQVNQSKLQAGSLVIKQGWFCWPNSPGIFWSNGQNAFCHVTQPKYVNGPVTNYPVNIPHLTSMRQDGNCPGQD